ncbi:MAG: CrcB family protein [Halovenus sp.]
MVRVIDPLFVGAGAVLGAWARFLTGELLERRTLYVLGVNVVGSFVFGALLAAPVTSAVFLFVGVGFCGSFTTFSSFAVESVLLFESNRRLAVLNAAGTLVATLLAVALGAGVVTLLA